MKTTLITGGLGFIGSSICEELLEKYRTDERIWSITGQNIIPLISDPFGFNWNMFGTKNYIPNFSIINARFVWILSVFSLVVGHIISVYISHKIASRSISSNKLVIQTQIPMLFLMVFYTAISLWIIAQPIVE